MNKTLIYGLDKGVGGSRPGCRWISAGSQISKNRKFFIFIFFTKHEKNHKILKIEYISAARRVNPLRPRVYFWTSFCPELVKL
jgi:hypothetical protein